ncbi:addiction module antidote protein [Sphingomonas parva]|uniref:Addiction module antidote protein n=1 Tax=Sphingomonas parva TaxID=2555898 RepID=A0A4Y8ZTY4_9SPHN|nr:addiction module antidote protein [Sphingomonas parva]TFI59493.1 addiction module antidote protein [Sphingomonas parva]
MRIECLARRAELQELPDQAVRAVRALRRWVAARGTGRCTMDSLRAQLGCLRAAVHLQLLLEEVGAAWPEPFSVSPPCCPRLSHDETTLAGMLSLAAAADRPGFDRLLSDLLAEDVRERLYHSARVLSGVLPA